MAEWEEKKTEETRKIESLFRTEFPQTDAYRFNSASIRVRVIDDRFEGKSIAEAGSHGAALCSRSCPRRRETMSYFF